MATAARVSLENYLAIDHKPEYELVNGELREKPMGTYEHMFVTKRLLALLAHYEPLSGIGIPELSVRHGDDVLIPDVAFLRPDTAVERGLAVEAPLLCVEILSPSQRPSEMFAKCETYHNWGVPYCWVIDPIQRVAWEYHQGQALRQASEKLDAGELQVSLPDLFPAS